MKSLSPLAIGVLLVAVAAGGCAPSKTAPTSVKDSDLYRSTHWMRNSAEYQAACIQTYRVAGEQLRRAVETKEPGTWAVALDADETLISNSGYEKELVELGTDSTDDLWMAWVAKRSAPPLPGALGFLAQVRELGGHIAVVTNRRERDCPDTRANLEAFEIPFDVLLCRKDDREKEPRWQSIEEGTASPDLPPLEIVMWLGDNINDFPDMTQASRFSSPEAFADYGTRFIVLPNPSYGSWEENPFE